jgi:hypothetical protein
MNLNPANGRTDREIWIAYSIAVKTDKNGFIEIFQYGGGGRTRTCEVIRRLIYSQTTEAFPWDSAPGCMMRDWDRIYGGIVTRQLRAMGIRDNRLCFAERLIGSIHRECLDHIVVFGEAHPRRIRPGFEFSVHTRRLGPANRNRRTKIGSFHIVKLPRQPLPV